MTTKTHSVIPHFLFNYDKDDLQSGCGKSLRKFVIEDFRVNVFKWEIDSGFPDKGKNCFNNFYLFICFLQTFTGDNN